MLPLALCCNVFVTSSVSFLFNFQSVFLIFLILPIILNLFLQRKFTVHSCREQDWFRLRTSTDVGGPDQPGKGNLSPNPGESKAAWVPRNSSMRPNYMQLNCLCPACQELTKLILLFSTAAESKVSPQAAGGQSWTPPHPGLADKETTMLSAILQIQYAHGKDECWWTLEHYITSKII